MFPSNKCRLNCFEFFFWAEQNAQKYMRIKVQNMSDCFNQVFHLEESLTGCPIERQLRLAVGNNISNG